MLPAASEIKFDVSNNSSILRYSIKIWHMFSLFSNFCCYFRDAVHHFRIYLAYYAQHFAIISIHIPGSLSSFCILFEDDKRKRFVTLSRKWIRENNVSVLWVFYGCLIYSFPTLNHSRLIEMLLFRPCKGRRTIFSFSINNEKVTSRSEKYGSAKNSYLTYFTSCRLMYYLKPSQISIGL